MLINGTLDNIYSEVILMIIQQGMIASAGAFKSVYNEAWGGAN